MVQYIEGKERCKIIMKLQIDELSKNYGDIQALDKVSMEMENGIYGLLGPNGAGKSTLINLLTDNVKRKSGHILWDGTEILKLGKAYRDILGYMPQEQGYYEDFTAGAFLMYMARVKGLKKKEAKERTEHLLKIVNLEANRNNKIASFSGGMRQRLMLAQALLNDPKILILDEPTAGVDPQERIRIRNFISQIAKDKIVILATHIISDVEAIAKEIVLLKKGKIIGKGTPEQLLTTLDSKVFEIYADKKDLEKLQEGYIISNLKNSKEGVMARVIGEKPSSEYTYNETAASLEDLYLYYFNE